MFTILRNSLYRGLLYRGLSVQDEVSHFSTQNASLIYNPGKFSLERSLEKNVTFSTCYRMGRMHFFLNPGLLKWCKKSTWTDMF